MANCARRQPLRHQIRSRAAQQDDRQPSGSGYGFEAALLGQPGNRATGQPGNRAIDRAMVVACHGPLVHFRALVARMNKKVLLACMNVKAFLARMNVKVLLARMNVKARLAR